MRSLSMLAANSEFRMTARLSGEAACAIKNFLSTACGCMLWASPNVERSPSPNKEDDALSGVTGRGVGNSPLDENHAYRVDA